MGRLRWETDEEPGRARTTSLNLTSCSFSQKEAVTLDLLTERIRIADQIHHAREDWIKSIKCVKI
jgi:hypothetical protein